MSWIADNWPMVAGFAAGLVAWGKTTTDVGNNKKSIEESRSAVSEMKDSIARIETHIEYTKSALEGMRQDSKDRTAALEEIRRELRAARK